MQQAVPESPSQLNAEPSRARRRGGPARMLWKILLANTLVFSAAGLIAELGLRLCWHPRFWVCSENWFVGSGQDRAGRKWWPNSSYWNQSREFRVRFQSNAKGYRARPEPVRTSQPYRIAFVGDSFTEATQVEYEQCFVSLLEHGLAQHSSGREIVAENYGVAATGVFDYWHRIAHDVLAPKAQPPNALVLCVYPGNDFIDRCPADGFGPDGQPKLDYFRSPSWPQHVLAWLNLKSKLVHFVFRTLQASVFQMSPPRLDAPPEWWNNPQIAASATHSSHLARIRALLRSVEDLCERNGTQFIIMIVPAHNYAAKAPQSSLAQIFSDWGIRAQVIDIAARANSIPRPSTLVFSLDGHLNPTGHEFVADAALEPLRLALGPDMLAAKEPSRSAATGTVARAR